MVDLAAARLGRLLVLVLVVSYGGLICVLLLAIDAGSRIKIGVVVLVLAWVTLMLLRSYRRRIGLFQYRGEK